MKEATSTNSRTAIPDYFTNPVLRPYLANVRNWQGYIRFLGLPDRRDNPDIIIDRLFVAPLVTRRYVSPDESPENWTGEAETLLDALAEDTLLVLLGDPGIGKSTFLNYVAWLLSRPATNALIDRLGWRLPLPMVLRELPVRGVKDFDELLKVFLSREISAPLREDNGRYLKQSLDEGQVFLLLDGIDELGDRETRENLRSAVFDGISRYPACRWLLTSRIVGYDEVPFDTVRNRSDEDLFQDEWVILNAKLHDMSPWPKVREHLQEMRKSEGARVTVRYIAPFDDRRIAAFARNWYKQREAAATRAGANANHLVRAIHADESILRLARVPNLLTLMALIHRIEATLPHGRALLYERIAEAYLESIDKFRGIDSSPHDLPRKKGWLGRVGFEMQRRRTSEKEADEIDILVDFDSVLGWLSEEMKHSDTFPGSPSAQEFLNIVGRRSGLFLPRGERRYAFVHLSFQEYFAAVALEREVTRLRWARREKSRLDFDRETLADWAGRSVWRETFAFLFELLASEEDNDWHADLLESVFGRNFSRLTKSKLRNNEREIVFNLSILLARLVVNSRSGFSSQDREKAITSCVEIQRRMPHGWNSQSIYRGLFGGDPELNAKVFEELKRIGVFRLDLKGIQIPDFMPLARLVTLKSLDLEGTGISDISPLSNLTALEWLDLAGTAVSDISPLSNLTTLKSLDLAGTAVSDISPLSNLTALDALHLRGLQISDASSLATLTNLRTLNLWDTKVSDLSFVVNLTTLVSLALDRTEVSDISPLATITALETLHLDDTQVTDLSPISGLVALENLHLWNTRVSDILSLKNLGALKWLDLDGTLVSDISPLLNLTELEFLYLRDTQVSRKAVQELRELLPNCRILSDY